MIVVTGAAGFIGSALVASFNAAGVDDLVISDNGESPAKAPNLEGKRTRLRVDREALPAWLEAHASEVQAVIHLGARTDTIEDDESIFEELNLRASQALWRRCAQAHIPLLYASSAATYGLGELGFVDDDSLSARLRPLNPYAASKKAFDDWALAQDEAPPFWAGLKFFNVYGPNEAHKGRMASVVFHAWNQLRDRGRVRLFRSHHPDYADGEQQRDFIYVKDVCAIIHSLLETRPQSGLYNVGTGLARTFLDLARATFAALDREPCIEWVDTPADLRDRYQYHTCAEVSKLREAGYAAPFTSLEDGVRDYVQGYLLPDRRL